MNPIIAQHLAPWLVAHIAEPSLRSVLLATFAGVALAACRPKSISTRLAIWTTVLYAALAMPFLGGILPAVWLRLPAIHAAKTRTVLVRAPRGAAALPSGRWMAARRHLLPMSSRKAGRETGKHGTFNGSRETSPAGNVAAVSQLQPKSPARLSIPAKQESGGLQLPLVAFVCLYLLVAAILLARVAMGIILRRRLQLGCETIDDLRTRALLDQNARTLGITTVPLLAESKAVAVPATMGIRHPAMLLPSGWRQWEAAKLGAVLAHELSHVKRRDALTQLLSAVHLSVFWFSPLAWWLDRKIAELAEEASDEAALRAGAGATYYAEVLLDFFAALRTAGRRVQWHAISLVQGSRAERRLDRIFRANMALPGRLRKPALVLLLACAAPVVCFIAAVRPSVMNAQSVPAASAELLPQAQPQPAPAPELPQGKIPSPAPNRAVPAAPSPAAPNPQFGTTVFPRRAMHKAPPAPAAMPQPASAPLPPPAALAALPPRPACSPASAPKGSLR
jgi:beta-lactamase regulating signal transducer with metallopeptidase domain